MACILKTVAECITVEYVSVLSTKKVFFCRNYESLSVSLILRV